jgi:hypothetical protein
MLGALFANFIPERYLSLKGAWLRLVAISGLTAVYAHLTQIIDHELNLPLQYASIAILLITLAFFIKAQLNTSLTKSE